MLSILIGVMLVCDQAPQQTAADAADRTAIEQALRDYADGFLGGSPERMAKAVSPYLSKRQLVVRPGGVSFISQMNADTLIDGSHGVKLPPEGRRITTAVLHVDGDVATASVFSSQFNDYVHLIKRAGAWQLLNVLWHGPGAAAPMPAEEAAGLEQTARAFLRALIEKDSAAVEKRLHPLAHWRNLTSPPQGRQRVVRELNSESLMAMLAAGQSPLRGDLAELQVVVEAIDRDIASVRARLGSSALLLHFTKQGDAWRVANVLSYSAAPPSAPSR